MNLPQGLPRFYMGGLVIPVAGIDLVVNRHRPVGANTQAENQLPQIRTVVFAVTVVQFESGARFARNPAKGHDGGAVVMNASHIEVEPANHLHDQTCHQQRPVSLIKGIKRPGKAIISKTNGGPAGESKRS